jgi:hypothetical protein
VCWRWAWATAFCARRAAAGEEPVGSVAAMAAARGVVAAVWMASKAAWWGKSVVGGVVAVGFDEFGGSESWDTGIGRVDDGQLLTMLRSAFASFESCCGLLLLACIVYRIVSCVPSVRDMFRPGGWLRRSWTFLPVGGLDVVDACQIVSRSAAVAMDTPS